MHIPGPQISYVLRILRTRTIQTPQPASRPERPVPARDARPGEGPSDSGARGKADVYSSEAKRLCLPPPSKA